MLTDARRGIDRNELTLLLGFYFKVTPSADVDVLKYPRDFGGFLSKRGGGWFANDGFGGLFRVTFQLRFKDPWFRSGN